MLDDLGATRRRLAATSRVAAWREVARRVAHEVKNPLAPIRAAVETLRRLRARGGPRVRRVLRRGDAHGARRGPPDLRHRHRVHALRPPASRRGRRRSTSWRSSRHVVQLQRAGGGRRSRSSSDARRRSARRWPIATRSSRSSRTSCRTPSRPCKDSRAGAVVVSSLGSGRASGVADHACSDNGPGVAPEIAARLFEPYATTKAHGTGLGLAIAQRIAIEHDGELSYVARGSRRRVSHGAPHGGPTSSQRDAPRVWLRLASGADTPKGLRMRVWSARCSSSSSSPPTSSTSTWAPSSSRAFCSVTSSAARRSRRRWAPFPSASSHSP